MPVFFAWFFCEGDDNVFKDAGGGGGSGRRAGEFIG